MAIVIKTSKHASPIHCNTAQKPWYTQTVNPTKAKKILIFILLFAAATRLWRLSYPEKFYFDEVYHAHTAIAYARNDPRGYEWWNPSPVPGTAYEWLHPPISKLLMAASIKLFGENSFAWRLPGALFGVLAIYLVYALTKELVGESSGKNIALLAAFLASLDGLLLVQSRIAMNDIYVTAFILASTFFYWRSLKGKSRARRKNLLLSGLCTGFAIATKWSAVFLLGIIGLMEIVKVIKERHLDPKRLFFLLPTAYFLLPILIYLLSYTQFFLQGHTLVQFKELHNQIIRYEFGLEATHPYQSKAWEWPLTLRPVWYHVDYQPQTIANIYALANPLLAWFGLIAVVWLGYQLIRSRFDKANYMLLAVSYFAFWLPWVVSPRIMFYYHYTPAITFLVIITALWLGKLNHQSLEMKGVSWGIIGLIVISFIFFYPLWTGLPIPQDKIDYFFWLSSWR